MVNEKRLIDANALMDDFRIYMAERFDRERCVSEENCKTCVRMCLWRKIVSVAPTVDAVEVESLRAWLYEIAMNNTDNPLSDACEEIISRLDGLRAFARERKDHG